MNLGVKEITYVLFIFIMAIDSCQTKTKVIPVDMTESNEAVTRILDAHWSAVKAKDAEAVIALVTDDFLSCGSDPKEFWNKTEMYNTIKQVFANTELETDITIDKREIRIAGDGKSAIALEQMFMKPFSQKLPVRTVYHLVKDKNRWLIDFSSTSFIPRNEDIDKLNKALE
jgi:uncharacterized protein (TIGR02246 family)